MDYKEKRKYWDELHSTKTLNKDIELLSKHNPKSTALTQVVRLKDKSPGRLEKEILWALLDVCSPEDIINNRKASTTGQKKSTKTKKAAAKKTTAKKATVKKTVEENKPATSNNAAGGTEDKTKTKNPQIPEQKEEDKKKSNEGSGVSGDKLEQS